MHVSGIFDLYNPANRDLTKANTVLLLRFGSGRSKFGEVIGPDSVHLRLDRAFTTDAVLCIVHSGVHQKLGAADRASAF